MRKTFMVGSNVALVTGASGFVGERLVHHLIGTARTVVGAYHRRKIEFSSIETVPIDLEDRSQVEDLLGRVRPRDIHHLASISDVAQCEREYDAARRAIVDATINLVEVAKRLELTARIIFVSTDQVYGGNPPDPKRGYSEEDVAEPLNVYGKLKREAEEIVLDAGGAVIRSALVYGPPSIHQPGMLANMVRALREGQLLSLFEDEIRTPLHVDDLCQACVILSGDDVYSGLGIWNVGGAERLNRVEMGEMVCDSFGLDRALLRRTCLAESTYPAPRPANVALCTDKYDVLVASKPRGFSAGVRELATTGMI